MKPEIKQRIDQLNNGGIPNGYKKTEFGVFPCDWVTEKSFGDLFDFYGGLGKSRDELGEEGYAYLHYGDLHRGTFNKVSFEQYNRLPKCNITLKGKETCLMEDGDVAFLDASEDLEGTSRAVLIDNPNNDPFIAGLHIIYGRPKDDSLEKWYKQYITSSESVKKQFQRLAVGFKVYGVNRDTLPKIKAAYPASVQEQSRIAEILMTWDKAIGLYNKQIDQIKRFKSICLAKMFPVKGKVVPEWRLRGFTDAWEQRKLGEVVDVQSGRDYKHLAEGDIPVYGTGGYMLSVNEALSYDEDAIGIGRKGTIDKPYVLKAPFWSVDTLFYAVPKANVDLDFAFCIFQNVDWKKKDESTGVPSLSKSTINLIDILIPALDEQIAIGAFFSIIDTLITLHQQKSEMVQKQRKALQQYLLSGIVRVQK